MRNGTFYLNNSGHRWVIYDNGKKPKVKIMRTQYCPFPEEEIVRTAIYFEAFGNFATAAYYYKGKLHTSINYELI